jgi:hypothetical protein
MFKVLLLNITRLARMILFYNLFLKTSIDSTDTSTFPLHDAARRSGNKAVCMQI